ncbi:MAG: UvrD-helicase domain-containing protein, partial [Planctomycetota bacterium]
MDAASRTKIREELHTNFLVEAAAGTGKTTKLVERMVELVRTGTCKIDQLVAVTFTRKAASELRDRFQLALREKLQKLEKVGQTQSEFYAALRVATDQVGQAFIGTIHSFCAGLLRERPIEFGVEPAFRELDENEDRELKKQAWQETMNDLIADGSPLVARLKELGLENQPLEKCFRQFLDFQDIPLWPADAPDEIDVDELKRETLSYIEEMRPLLPLFPADRGGDKMMAQYEKIVRMSDRSFRDPRDFFSLLELFDKSDGSTLKCWHDRDIAKSNKTRWLKFREDFAGPGMAYWARKRYPFVLELLQLAVAIYQKLRRASEGLGFDDLLRLAAVGLKRQSELRKYFQGKYTHILVDEFQDTDPIQAEMLLYLTSEDTDQQDWTQCVPKPGSLFLVGDPKQSIYRFRRGDIVTYKQVQDIFTNSGGQVLPLVKNFRSGQTVREWVNSVFQEKFGTEANQYGPAARNMVQGRLNAPDSETEESFQGVFKLTIAARRIEDATAEEAQSIARFIRHAIDTKLALPRRAGELKAGQGPAQPRDFLIIPYGKKRIEYYKEALDQLGIPCEVNGANAFQDLSGLDALLCCLRALEDPNNPVYLLAVLRNCVFALDDQSLFALKLAKGRFNFLAPLPDGLEKEVREKLEPAFARLKSYHRMLHSMPHASALIRIAQDLGLLAESAAGSEGNVQAGSLLKALEAIRQESHNFDNAADAINCLERVLEADESTASPALPNDGNVVRVMNLHKAKGLEAPVVFLASTVKAMDHKVHVHVDRSASETAGYLAITTEKEPPSRGSREVAVPLAWEEWQSQEKQFLQAEELRLLYVAATRAESCLVISKGSNNCRWAPLYNHLGGVAELPTPHMVQPNRGTQEAAGAEAVLCSVGTWLPAWNTARQQSYQFEAAKTLGLQGKSRPKWEASGDYGHNWGSAMHDLLEAFGRNAKSDLNSLARMLCEEYELDSARSEELLATAQSVIRSKLWERARSANQCFVELPFDTPSQDANPIPTAVRGVIDLVFQEDQGWVIVDYKTDDVSVAQIPEAVNYYRGQLQQY